MSIVYRPVDTIVIMWFLAHRLVLVLGRELERC
jgi:hypothetical protein